MTLFVTLLGFAIVALLLMLLDHLRLRHPEPPFAEVKALLPAKEDSLIATLGPKVSDTLTQMEACGFVSRLQGYVTLTREGEEYWNETSSATGGAQPTPNP